MVLAIYFYLYRKPGQDVKKRKDRQHSSVDLIFPFLRATDMIENLLGHILINFQSIVEGLHATSLQKPSVLDLAKYLITYIVFPGVAVLVYDHYNPIFQGVNLYLVLVIATPTVLLIPALIFACCRNIKSGKWLLNWQLRRSSRYLELCQLSDNYKEQLLPKDIAKWHFQLAGSASDGFGFFPTLASNNGIFPWSNPCLIQDVDINVFYNGFVLEDKDLVHESQGYCSIKLTREYLPSDLNECAVDHHWLSGKLVSDKIGNLIPGKVEYNYPAITHKTILNGPQGNYSFNTDIVFGIKLSSWPAIACKWEERMEDILPRNLIDSIIGKGCYVVHKHCLVNHPSHDCDWRITFAVAETQLFRFHSAKNALKLCYVILKFAIKQQSTANKKFYPALKSYHLKTILLWVAENEKHLPFDLYNISNNNKIGALLLHLLSEYKKCLHDGFLRHYFIPEINLMEPYSEKERTDGIHLIEEFQVKPLNMVTNFDKANMSRRKFEQFLMASVIIANACQILQFYFSNIGEIFAYRSVMGLQIFAGCAIFGIFMIFKIILG